MQTAAALSEPRQSVGGVCEMLPHDGSSGVPTDCYAVHDACVADVCVRVQGTARSAVGSAVTTRMLNTVLFGRPPMEPAIIFTVVERFS